MNEDLTLTAVYGLACLVLVGSALVARRLPMREWVRMGLAWIAIFSAAYFAVVLFRGLAQ